MIMFCASSLPRSARVTFPRRAPGSWTPPIKALTYHYHTAALGKGKLDACRNQKVESIKTYDHGLEKNLWKPKRLFKAKTFFFFLEFRIKSGRVGTPVKFLLHLCPPVRRFALSIGQTKKLELSPEQEVRRNPPPGTQIYEVNEGRCQVSAFLTQVLPDQIFCVMLIPGFQAHRYLCDRQSPPPSHQISQ